MGVSGAVGRAPAAPATACLGMGAPRTRGRRPDRAPGVPATSVPGLLRRRGDGDGARGRGRSEETAGAEEHEAREPAGRGRRRTFWPSRPPRRPTRRRLRRRRGRARAGRRDRLVGAAVGFVGSGRREGAATETGAADCCGPSVSDGAGRAAPLWLVSPSGFQKEAETSRPNKGPLRRCDDPKPYPLRALPASYPLSTGASESTPPFRPGRPHPDPAKDWRSSGAEPSFPAAPH